MDAITYVGVDLSQTSLSESERAAVAWSFASEHGAELVQGTRDELAEQGYIDQENLLDGCLFSIAETGGGKQSVTFDAQKWRSGLGGPISLMGAPPASPLEAIGTITPWAARSFSSCKLPWDGVQYHIIV